MALPELTPVKRMELIFIGLVVSSVDQLGDLRARKGPLNQNNPLLELLDEYIEKARQYIDDNPPIV